jgi:hypothetical protein
VILLLVLASFAIAGTAVAEQQALPRTEAPEGAEVYFVSPQNGETVASPVTVVFGLRGMGVAPAGVNLPATGHHHLIIDAPTPNLDLPIPTDANHRHFGAGQTEVTVSLEPGTHTLQLVLGDLNHVPHSKPVVSETITITVKK